MRVFWFLATLVASVFAWVGPAFAHPHEFVSMRIDTRFDKEGRANAFTYHWAFDEFFTAYALEGKDTNGDGTFQDEEVMELLKEILGNIAEIDYFTAFDANGVVPEFDVAVPKTATLDNRQLKVSFRVPFKKPISVSEKPLRFAVYDGEFYIAFNLETEGDVLRLMNANPECKGAMTPADPDDSLAAFAASLDKTESGGNDLGRHFAEWIEVKCP